MRFILRGKAYDLTREDVEQAMRGIQPEAARLYFFNIKGKKFPPKQILSVSLNLARIEFTTADATNLLKRLGFELQKY